MELREYLNLFKKWLWLLLLGAILGGAAGYAFSMFQEPLYQTQTNVMVMRPPEESTNQFYNIYNELQLVKTYSQLITTEPVLKAASDQLGVNILGGQVSVRQLPDSLILEVTVRDGDPVNAAKIANSLVGAFIEYNATLQNNRFSSSEESLQAQIDQVESQINSLQSELSQVSEESLTTQQTQVEAQITELEAQIVQLQNQMDSNDPENLEADRILQDQVDQLQYLLRIYQQIYVNLQIYGERGPSGSAVYQPEQLTATLNLYQQIYANLLNNYENIRLARLRSTPNVVQIDTATVPTVPVQPRPMRNALLGAAVGFFLMGGIAFLIEYLDDTLKTPEDVHRALGVPVIGMIGEMGGKKNKETVYVAKHPRSPVAEAYRTLRTNLEFASVDKPLNTILVTSAEPNIGKSTVAANLAVTMVQGEHRVALIDADMRRPGIHRLLNIPNLSGLSDLFRSQSPPPNALKRWGEPPIYVLTSGSLPPNPSELVASQKMEKIMGDFKKVTDTIILDGPPFIVSDPIVLSSKVDGVLLVIKPGATKIEAAQAMIEQLQRAGAWVVGVVLNPISRKQAGYYGKYRHYSEYYDSGYGYGQTTGGGKVPAPTQGD